MEMERIKLIRVTDTSLGRIQPGSCPKLPKDEAKTLRGGTNPYAVKWESPEAQAEREAAEKRAKAKKLAKVKAKAKPAKPPKGGAK